MHRGFLKMTVKVLGGRVPEGIVPEPLSVRGYLPLGNPCNRLQ